MAQRDIKILESDYGENVKVTALVPVSQYGFVEAEITEGTNGRAEMERQEEVYFGVVDKEVILFEG